MVHQYKLLGYNIILDISSGAVHVVDDIAYDIIALFEGNEKEYVIEKIKDKYPQASDIEECYAQVEALKKNGELFTEDTFEDKADTLKAKTQGVIKALCLHIAHTCNLNCSYCFAERLCLLKWEKGLLISLWKIREAEEILKWTFLAESRL